jgi:murein DD-endopeptidase MepM/ murein hydrolase activator NlpD
LPLKPKRKKFKARLDYNICEINLRESELMTEIPMSHAFVLPEENFQAWYNALKPYLSKFERVSVIRNPGGNDLNPYRNVSAVLAPKTWMNNSPLEHIRRVYPSVVRIDTVKATTPQELAVIVQKRIANNDRFGAKDNDGHINDRFILDWPTDFKPFKLTRPFTTRPTGTNADVLGLEIAAQAGSKVLAAVAGTVTKQWAGEQNDALNLGKYIQVTTNFAKTQYIVTYAGLSSIRVPLNTPVAIGDDIGRVAGDRFTVIVQQAQGSPGYRLPNIVNPNPLIYITNLRVRPTSSGLRVRTIPQADGEILGVIQPYDQVTPLEQHGRVLAKMGVEGEWVHVKMPDGRDGYAAAWFLAATQYKRYALDVNPVGVNLDQLHPLGAPDPARLGKIGWVRFGYNVSNGRGSEDIVAAYNRYAPVAEKYARAGYKVLFATSHQTYGEAKDFGPWPAMTDEKWAMLTGRFAEMMGKIAQQWAGKGLVHCWQVWNEQDAPIGAIASVPMSPQNYGKMLAKLIPAIKASDSDVHVITGGHTSGPVNGSNYAKAAIKIGGAGLDGIAFHPYGRGANTASPYAQYGHIDEEIQHYIPVLPEKPLWITEWGVLDKPNDSPSDISNYAADFISHLKSKYPGKIACMIWYAWAQGMHNGYGIVDGSGNARIPLTERFLQA